MTLDERLSRAVRHIGDGVVVPDVDLDEVRVRALANRRRVVSISVAVTAAVVALIVASTTLVAGRDSSAPVSPSHTQSPSGTESTLKEPLPSVETGPRSWTPYTSTRYRFAIGYPPEWTVTPASRDWSWGTDAESWLSAAHEVFLSPGHTIRVSAWSAPLDPSTREESYAYLEGWVEDYCVKSGNSPCTGIAGRAVRLCLEKWDCHPGLLVPFKDDVQAFFSGGDYDNEAMTIVAVWRGETTPEVAPYGGAQQLLEDFLTTMQVWPADTPRYQRQ